MVLVFLPPRASNQNVRWDRFIRSKRVDIRIRVGEDSKRDGLLRSSVAEQQTVQIRGQRAWKTRGCIKRGKKGQKSRNNHQSE